MHRMMVLVPTLTFAHKRKKIWPMAVLNVRYGLNIILYFKTMPSKTLNVQQGAKLFFLCGPSIAAHPG